ncbi:MAG: Na+/H+ antiporter subunit E [Devosia sp.]
MTTLRRLGDWIGLMIYFLGQLIASAIRVAFLSLRPQLGLRPSIVDYPLTVPSDAEITLLANMITLTPGTLSIDVSEDRKWLHIHCLDTPDSESVINAIAGGFETRVLGLFR